MKIEVIYHNASSNKFEVDVEKEYQLDHILAKKGWVTLTCLETKVRGKVNLDWVMRVVLLDDDDGNPIKDE